MVMKTRFATTTALAYAFVHACFDFLSVHDAAVSIVVVIYESRGGNV